MDSLLTSRNLDAGPESNGAGLGKTLGLFGLGLGAAQVAAPRTLAELIGLEPSARRSAVLRGLGVREIVSGLTILLRPRKAMPLWARVAGDALDLALLAWAARADRSSTRRLLFAAAATLGVTAVDVLAAARASRVAAEMARPVVTAVTIRRPVHEVYAYWRELTQLPQFMDYLDKVEVLDDRRSKWTAKLPIAGSVSWEAEIVDEQPFERIEWRTLHSAVRHHGRVTFARVPGGGDATEVRVELELGAPGIPASPALAKLLTKSQIKGDLRRLKQVLETGEVLRSDASVHRGPHPAQPSEVVR